MFVVACDWVCGCAFCGCICGCVLLIVYCVCVVSCSVCVLVTLSVCVLCAEPRAGSAHRNLALAHCDLALAVEVRQCPMRSGAAVAVRQRPLRSGDGG